MLRNSMNKINTKKIIKRINKSGRPEVIVILFTKFLTTLLIKLNTQI